MILSVSENPCTRAMVCIHWNHDLPFGFDGGILGPHTLIAAKNPRILRGLSLKLGTAA